jgi:phage protein D
MAAAPSIVSARPTIAIGGQQQPSLALGLLGMQIAETTAGLYRCEIVVGNWGAPNSGRGSSFLYFDRSLVDFGKAVQVGIAGKTLFDGVIVGLEANFTENGQPELTILAEDKLQDLRLTRRTRTFENTSDGDLFNTVAGDHNLTPNVSLPAAKYRVIAQVNQSDLALLRDRARAIDAEVWVDGTTLNAQPRAQRRGASLTLGYRHELYELSVLADLANQRTALAVSGWDVKQKTAIRYEATDSALGAELGSDTSGASLVRSTFGERKETVVHTVPWNNAEAQARAEAHFRTMARSFVSARGVAQTDPGLRVGANVTLAGVGPLFEGKYYVTEVTHLFDGESGLRTEFCAERPGLGRP